MATPNSATKRILLVDDDENLLDAMHLALEVMGEVIPCTTLEQVEHKLATESFDIVVTDFKLQNGTGHDVLNLARTKNPNTPVILVTAFADKEVAIKSIDLRVHALLEKPVDLQKLKDAVNRAFTRSEHANQGTKDEEQILKLNESLQEVVVRNRRVSLTRTEFKILDCLWANRNQRLSRHEMVSRVWPNMEVSEHTLETHFTNLRKKLPELKYHLIVVRGIGYVFAVEGTNNKDTDSES